MTSPICEQCGSSFPAKWGKANRFCSLPCYHAFGRPDLRKDRVKGHRVERAVGHPLAPKSGRVIVSRRVLYDKIGPGPHLCHWCNAPIEWMPGHGLRPGALVADHLDFDYMNDAPENLVPSCNICNAHRTPPTDRRKIQPGELWIMQRGQRARAVERTCESCGKIFLASLAQVKYGKGRFCSRSCASKLKPDALTVEWAGRRVGAVERFCNSCGQPFLVPPSVTKAGKGRYCSRPCARRSQRIH